MTRRILILGGSGILGMRITRFLAKQGGNLELLVAGRDLVKAKKAVDTIIHEIPNSNVSAVAVNASDKESLEQAFIDIDMVVVASSTIKYVENVANTAVKTGTDYLDAQLSSPYKLSVLRRLEDQIINSGKVFITDGGFHPGLLAAIVRWAEMKVGPLNKANVYGALKVDWDKILVNHETVVEMVEEFRYFDMTVLRDGQWVKTKYSESVEYDFESPFGKQYCAPMLIEEVRMLSEEYPNLKEAGFYVTGFNKILDYVLLPLIIGLVYIKLDSLAGRLFKFGLRFSKAPFGVKLVAECEGEKGKMKIKFWDNDGYTLTAIPIVACLQQYLDGAISNPGLHWQAWVVEPERFFDDMNKMGLEFTVSSEQAIGDYS